MKTVKEGTVIDQSSVLDRVARESPSEGRTLAARWTMRRRLKKSHIIALDPHTDFEVFLTAIGSHRMVESRGETGFYVVLAPL